MDESTTGRYISITIVKKRQRENLKKNQGGNSIGCGGQGLSKDEVWAVGGAYA